MRSFNKPLINNWLIDMDGVLIHETKRLPYADIFINKLKENNTPFLILTNNSTYTTNTLSERLHNLGLDIQHNSIWTSSLATAEFLYSQDNNKSTVYILGEEGLKEAILNKGYTISNKSPEYVILGEMIEYNIDSITHGIRLILNGAKFIATNPDTTGPSHDGITPATGAIAALITSCTNVKPYYVGKPNPLMIREGLNQLSAHSENTAIIGDRMDTDIISGLEAGMYTYLMLTGITTKDDLNKYTYKPNKIINSLNEIIKDII